VINTLENNISYYILNISIPDINGETIVHLLEQKEIYISTGSACSSKLKKPEKTILALTKSEKLSTTSIRISLSHLTTYQEIDELLEILNKL
jgi:cysteine desulfurase